MKKLTLLLSVMLFWGCSQASDQEAAKAAVKAQSDVVQAEAKEQIAKTIEEAKETAEEKVMDEAKSAMAKAVEQPKSNFQAGIHYRVINPAYNTGTEDEVIVYEFFGYTCPHCASFEPFMKKLQAELPENSKLVRVPVVFGRQWEPFAQAYYTFEAMGIVDKAHEPMFEAIHQHRKQFRSIEEIAAWAASSFGVDEDKFLSTAKSFMVDGQVRKGMQMVKAMGVNSTPTLVTNGKFIPNNQALRTRNDVLEVTKQLVNEELAAME